MMNFKKIVILQIAFFTMWVILTSSRKHFNSTFIKPLQVFESDLIKDYSWCWFCLCRGENNDECSSDSAALTAEDKNILTTISSLLAVDYDQLVQVLDELG